MKHVLLKSALISFAMVAAATAWARDSTPDAARQTTATDRAMVDRAGNPRSLRAQWVYRIVAKWGAHVQEAYRTDPRRWADSMAQVFAKASPDALKRAAEARTFAAMNDALLTPLSPVGTSAPRSASGGKALGDPDRDLVYVPVAPCRILDTRNVGGPIAANSVRDFDLADAVRYSTQGGDTSNCNVGNKGSFAAAAINFTVVNPNAAGYITAFAYLASQPTAATINYVAGDIRNGFTIVRLDQSAATNEFSVYSFAQTHLVADVVGYFINPDPVVIGLPASYWATSTGTLPCTSYCSPEGVAAATSSGMVCKRADGSSDRYEYYYSGNVSYYSCGPQSRTAQCSCIRK
jgi:hypothetical protein